MLYLNLGTIVLNLCTLAFFIWKMNKKVATMEKAVSEIPHLDSYLKHVLREEKLVDETMGPLY